MKIRAVEYYKYLFSFGAIFLVPILIMGSVMLNNYDDILRDEVIHNNLNQLDKTKLSLDAEILKLQNIYYHLQFYPNLNRETVNSESVISFIDLASQYQMINKTTDEILLYPRNGEYLFGSSGSYSVNFFMNKVYKFANFEPNQLLNLLKTIDHISFYPAQDTVCYNTLVKRYILCVAPLPMDSKKPIQTAIFLIDEKNLLQYLNNKSTVPDENTLILNHNNQIITSTVSTSYTSSKEFQKIIDSMESDYSSQVQTLDNTRYLISKVKSNTTGWSYVHLIPENIALAKLYGTRTLFLYTILAALILGGILIPLLMYFNYNPLRELFSFIKKMHPSDESEEKAVYSVKQAVLAASFQYSKLERQIQDSQPARKEHMLSQLLSGDNVDLKDPSLINFKYASYFTAIMEIKDVDTASSQGLAEVAAFLENNFPGSLDGYCKLADNGYSIILLLSTEFNDETTIGQAMNHMRVLLQEHFDINPIVSVGAISHEISGFAASFIQARSALDYKLTKKKVTVIFWSDVSIFIEPSIMPKLNSLVYRLASYLKQMSYDDIEKTLQEITEIIDSTNLPLNMAKFIFFDIVTTVRETIHELDILLPDHALDQVNILKLAEISTIEDLLSFIRILNNIVHEFTLQRSDLSSLKLINEIVAHINKYYSQYDFSIEAIADKFSLSVPYLRKLFKESTGRTIYEYVSSLRIKKAKNLLEHSSKTLNDIVAEIGYADVSSFVRKFKQETGITPGEFRKSYQWN